MLTKLHNVCVIPTTLDEFIELQELVVALGGEWANIGKAIYREWPLHPDKAIVLDVETSLCMYFVSISTIGIYQNRRRAPIGNVLLTLKTLVNIKENS